MSSPSKFRFLFIIAFLLSPLFSVAFNFACKRNEIRPYFSDRPAEEDKDKNKEKEKEKERGPEIEPPDPEQSNVSIQPTLAEPLARLRYFKNNLPLACTEVSEETWLSYPADEREAFVPGHCPETYVVSNDAPPFVLKGRCVTSFSKFMIAEVFYSFHGELNAIVPTDIEGHKESCSKDDGQGFRMAWLAVKG